jgi:sugar lactone lactonase YvrE
MKIFSLTTIAVGLLPTVLFGQASLFDRYDVKMTGWAQLPPDMPWGGETSWVAADGKGQVVVMMRKAPVFRFFARDGKFLKAWGDQSLFNEAHSVYFDAAGFLWGVDAKDHVALKFDPDGKVVMTLGKKGVTGDNSSHDAFNRPSTLFIARDGHIFVGDGYENSRVVEFTGDGKFVRIFGGVKGSAPGQMQLIHGVVVDSKGRVIASDSDNKRLTVFDKDGKFLETWPAPCRGGIAIAPDDTIYVSDVNAGMVAILKEGKILDVIHVDGRPLGLGLDPTTLDVYTTSSVVASPNVTKAAPKKPKTEPSAAAQ